MSASEDSTTAGESTQTELEPRRAAEMLESSEAQLVDVRQDFEWEAGRIPGALHIPLETLPARAGELESERPVIFVCRSGSRSGMAVEAFRASGFEAYNLSGGLQAWLENGLEVEPEGGEVALPRPDNS